MKRMKKLLAVVLSVAVALTMGVGMTATVFANETSAHTITITNTDQNVTHSYEAYQVFVGKLDAQQQKLSDIQWGEGVNGPALLAALKASTNAQLMTGDPAKNAFTDCTTAADVAKVLATFSDTSAATASSGAIDEVAKIIAETSGVLVASKKVAFENDGTSYTASVTGDGYYFIKDTTSTLTGTSGSDTLSKYLLAVVKNTTIVAKDTGLTPDKEIVSGTQRVKTGTSAVGDSVTFEVKIKVPDTRKYVDHFVFDMQDKLPKGMTFTGITSVKVGSDAVAYDLYLNGTKQETFTPPTDPVDAGAPSAAQTIKLVFKNFKAFAETAGKNYIGQDMVVTYTAVVNKNADFTSTGNLNEVFFDYSNDPNHDYNGDTPDTDEPMGKTPTDETKTLLTNIELLKTGDDGKVTALEGAEFKITSDDYNVTLVTGEKFEQDAAGTYYKLKDGSYTDVAPTTETASSYDSTEIKYKKVTFSNVVTTPGSSKTVTVITGADGKIVLNGLKAGTYTLQETKAPSGYNLDSTTYTIKLDLNGNQTTTTGTDAAKIELNTTASSAGVTYDGTTATAKITIDNKAGSVLPSTGGIGTTIFYILGALLVIGAGILLIARRRMTAK